jgi:hypothetical protein
MINVHPITTCDNETALSVLTVITEAYLASIECSVCELLNCLLVHWFVSAFELCIQLKNPAKHLLKQYTCTDITACIGERCVRVQVWLCYDCLTVNIVQIALIA